MARIPDTFIDDLLHRVDIVEVINQRVPLKRAGREYTACCPFHEEKTPSFTVSATKQFYHCFGCGAHGSAIRFLMEYEGLGFVDSVNELARSVGMEVPLESGQAPQVEKDQKQPLYDLLEQANRYYQQQLRSHAQAPTAVDYLKNRGVSGAIAKQYEIGFAPSGWDNLKQALRCSDEQLLEAGLSARADSGKVYDRLRERITFPIRDQRGRLCGFGGRILAGDGAKYLNSPETAIFHKGEELYGLYQLQQAERHPRQVVVVEGYLDVIALAQHGASYAVAALGTALTSAHIRKLFRVTSKLVLCFDGDKAGKRAAERSLEQLLPHMQDGRQAEFLFLPQGDDPDTYIRREGLEGFEAQLMKCEPLSEFLFRFLQQECDLQTMEGRAKLAERARPWVNRIPKGFFQKLVRDELNRMTGVDLPENLETTNRREPRPRGQAGSTDALSTPAQPNRPLRKAFVYLLNHPQLVAQISADQLALLSDQEGHGMALFRQLVEFYLRSTDSNLSLFIEQLSDSRDASHLATLSQTEPPAGDPASWSAEFCSLIDDLTGVIHHQRGRLGDHHRKRWNQLTDKFTKEGLSPQEQDEYRQLRDHFKGQSKQ
ncbi:MAG TPA: DNA primase [Gammaproteobacteria bacterium]|nr:DNA primase [Gammaproteobacteria bacterium]